MKRILLYLALVLGSAGIVSTVGPLVPSAAAAGNCNDVRLLTFPAWYRGLTKGNVPNCEIISPGDNSSGDFGKDLTGYITIIALNVLEIMLQLVVYICAGFIIWGGFMYLISTGSSDKISSGKKMIQNALIGLVISLFAVIAVSFIVRELGV